MDMHPDFPTMLRGWRQRRRLSQLALADEADISTRHLSFLETGKARPSREMLLKLAASLELPLRETDALLLAGGYAPQRFRPLSDGDPYARIDPQVDMLLEGFVPFPAIVIDRYWTIHKVNRAAYPLLAGVSETLLTPPLNAIRIGLHPQGLAPRILNYPAWRAHLLERLKRQIRLTGDAALQRLYNEAVLYPALPAAPFHEPATTGPVVPLRIKQGEEILNLISTTTVFGTPVDVEVSELAIEAFLPADEATRRLLQTMV